MFPINSTIFSNLSILESNLMWVEDKGDVASVTDVKGLQALASKIISQLGEIHKQPVENLPKIFEINNKALKRIENISDDKLLRDSSETIETLRKAVDGVFTHVVAALENIVRAGESRSLTLEDGLEFPQESDTDASLASRADSPLVHKRPTLNVESPVDSPRERVELGSYFAPSVEGSFTSAASSPGY